MPHLPWGRFAVYIRALRNQPIEAEEDEIGEVQAKIGSNNGLVFILLAVQDSRSFYDAISEE
jgi:hypothetical protein